MSDDFQRRVDGAVADLERVGRHWLPDQGSEAIHAAVMARWPGRTIIRQEPHPWDEHVLCDVTDASLPDMQLSHIAARRKELRERSSSAKLPV